MADKILNAILGIGILYTAVWFFCILGLKRPLGGWTAQNPTLSSAMLAGFITIIIVIGVIWKALWGADALLAAFLLLGLIALVFVLWKQKPRK